MVCRQLQYAPVAVKAYTIPIYGAGRVSFSLRNCIGYESNLIYCYHSPPGYLYTFSSSYAVAVRCQGEVKILFLPYFTVSTQHRAMNVKLAVFAWWVGTPVMTVGLRYVKEGAGVQYVLVMMAGVQWKQL